MNPTNNPKKKRSQATENDSEDTLDTQSPVASGVAHSPVATSNGSSAISSSNFRNVSACNRCRLRKNRCDQKLPACTSCEKANVKCVGFDPVSKREIPRSYVYYLETRVQALEGLLQANDIPCPATDDFSLSLKEGEARNASSAAQASTTGVQLSEPAVPDGPGASHEHDEQKKLSSLVRDIGMVPVQGASDHKYLGSTSGISFARVVFAAVKSSVANGPSDRSGARSSKPSTGAAATGGTSMRDSFFGLHTKPTIKPAPFPDKDLASRLVELYFENSNPQIPILHRGEFEALFERVYSVDEKKRTPRELYLLNIIFATGSGIIMDHSDAGKADHESDGKGPNRKKQKLSHQQCQPEEYHASAIIHLESFLGSSSTPEGSGSGLEELQAVLLLAGFSLLRPVAPGLWYIVGVAVRLAVDLGLHNEDPEAFMESQVAQSNSLTPAEKEELGRRQYIRDLRRRLWWCVYSLDRLVSTCVGRPFGITDQVITTEFPTLLDDKYISHAGFITPPEGSYGTIPSYKHVSYHYFRMRLLQSEILQVLQHRQTQQVRERGLNSGNQWMHVGLPSPFLDRFTSYREWRSDIDRRLAEWIDSSPTQTMTGVAFSPLFYELNYWQTVIMLYRQSLSVPPSLAGELSASTGDDVTSPGHVDAEEQGDEEMVFLKVAEAGQKVLKIYRQLHRVRLVNYTFLATHHLFMCGISFLYAIWHSPLVRSKLTLDDVDFTVLAATSVLNDLMRKCPPAEACRDAFDRMAKATVSYAMRNGGFGEDTIPFLPIKIQKGEGSSGGLAQQTHDGMNPFGSGMRQSQNNKRALPRFDMDFKDLFSDDEFPNRRSYGRLAAQRQANAQGIKIEPSSGTYRPTMPPPLQSPSQYPSQQQQQRQQASPRMFMPSPPIDPSLQMSVGPSSRPSPTSSGGGGGAANPYFPAAPSYTGTSGSATATATAAGTQHPSPSYPNSFDGFDFLDAFQPGSTNTNDPQHPHHHFNGFVAGSSDGLGGAGPNGALVDYDLGFGVGGLAFDGGAGQSWDEHANFDLFDGFFFGGTNAAGNGGGGGGGSTGSAAGSASGGLV